MCKRRGAIAIYCILALGALLTMAALALDWARVQLVKTELSSAADPSARYGVGGLQDGTYASRAIWLASQNSINNAPLILAPADVEYGTWNKTAKVFVPGGANPTAVRVTARRTVRLALMDLLGVSEQQITVRAVAKGGTIGYGLIGLNSVSFAGNATASYSSLGPYAADQGHVASNGNITLAGSSSINGKTYTGVGYSSTGGTVTGGRETLPAPLSFPNGDAGVYATTNNNAAVPDWAFASPGRSSNSIKLDAGAVLTLPAGQYYWNNLTMTGGAELRFAGPSSIYCYGTVSMTGNTYTASNTPQNLQLVMCPQPNGTPPGTLYISSSAALYASVYAPQSDVTIKGSGTVYGSVLGKTVTVGGSAQIYYDVSLDSSNGQLSLVE